MVSLHYFHIQGICTYRRPPVGGNWSNPLEYTTGKENAREQLINQLLLSFTYSFLEEGKYLCYNISYIIEASFIINKNTWHWKHGFNSHSENDGIIIFLVLCTSCGRPALLPCTRYVHVRTPPQSQRLKDSMRVNNWEGNFWGAVDQSIDPHC